MKYLSTIFMRENNKLFAILAMGLLTVPIAASADPLTVTYDFTASNFSDGLFDGTPPPVDTVAGSFGFTFEPITPPPNIEITPDFVDLSILGFDYTIDYTGVEMLGSGVFAAIIFGGLNSGPGGTSAFTNDVALVFYINNLGDVVPDSGASVVVRVEDQFDAWLANSPDVSVTRRSPEPGTLLEQLGTAVAGVGPGTSLADKVILAQTYFAVPDVEATCAVLTGFLNQVRAQRGKKLTLALADQLTADAETIMDAIGCD